MHSGDMNFNCLDLRNRVADTSLVEWVYSQHPEWNRSARRLNTTLNRKNTRLWKGDTLVDSVDVAACWVIGYWSEGCIDSPRRVRDFYLAGRIWTLNISYASKEVWTCSALILPECESCLEIGRCIQWLIWLGMKTMKK